MINFMHTAIRNVGVNFVIIEILFKKMYTVKNLTRNPIPKFRRVNFRTIENWVKNSVYYENFN